MAGSANSEEYGVRRKWVERVMHEFAVTPDRDCFATGGNARFPRYYTQEQDALSLRWDESETMWCNPPWTEWPKVADKILRGKNRCVCVVPAWYSRAWVHDLVKAATRILYVEKGHRVFELDGQPVEGIRWGLFFLLIDPEARGAGGPVEERKVEDLSEDDEEEGESEEEAEDVPGEEVEDVLDMRSVDSEEDDDVLGDPSLGAETGA